MNTALVEQGKSPAQYFVGIGAQKAGTTWLADYFSRHPQVAFSPIKELHHFDSIHEPNICFPGLRGIFARQMQAVIAAITKSATPRNLQHFRCLVIRELMLNRPELYAEYFSQIVKPKHRVFGEITPRYALMTAAGFRNIQAVYPQAKLIYILRDPVDRHWSQLKMKDKRTDGKVAAEEHFQRSLEDMDILPHSEYDRTLRVVREVFPGQAVHICFFETLTDPGTHEQALRALTDFLGIDYIRGDVEKKVHVGSAKELQVEHSAILARRFRHVYEFIRAEFPQQIPERWLERMQ